MPSFFFSSQSCWLKQTVSEGCEKRKFHKNKQPSQRRLSWKKLTLNLSHVKHFFCNRCALEDFCLNSTHPHSAFRKGQYDPDGFLVFARNDTLGDSWIPGLRQE